MYMKEKIIPLISVCITCVFFSLFANSTENKFSTAVTDWDRYPTYQEYLNIMESLERDYPDKVKIHEIGTSVMDRKLLVANISDNIGVKENEPKFLWLAGLHGNEMLPIMNSMRMIHWLCSNYGQDERATGIIDNIDLWISPMMNPDGTYYGTGPEFQPRRYNANGVDLNRNWPRIPGGGISQTPEKETKAYLDFVNAHTFVMNITWHSGIECYIYPWFNITRRHPDDRWWQHAARTYADQAQNDGPSGFFDDVDDGISWGYASICY